MKPKNLLHLKHLLKTSTDLSQPSAYFWEKIARDPGFMTASKVASNVQLRALMEEAASQALGGEQVAEMLLLLRIRKQGFWHGSCTFGDKMAQIIYFEDINHGLLSILMNPRTGMTHYVRISLLEVSGGGGAIPVNPRNKPSA